MSRQRAIRSFFVISRRRFFFPGTVSSCILCCTRSCGHHAISCLIYPAKLFRHSAGQREWPCSYFSKTVLAKRPESSFLDCRSLRLIGTTAGRLLPFHLDAVFMQMKITVRLLKIISKSLFQDSCFLDCRQS